MKNVINAALVAISVLLLAIFSTISCKQAAEKQQEKALENAIERGSGDKADVDIDNEKITIESEGNKVVVKTGEEKWPSAIPNDVPQLNTGKVTGTTITEMEGGQSWSVRYQGIEISELDKYGARLKAAGFKITTMKSSEGGMVTGEKGNLAVIFTVSPEISVIAVTEQKN